MRHKKPENRDLPPRMIRRTRKGKKGQVWITYYYNGRDAADKRKEIPLGTDLDQARVEWARLERKAPPKSSRLMGYLFDRYEKEIIPGKSIRTQSDNHKELKQLRRAFESAPIESITPQVWPNTVMPERQKSGPTGKSPCSPTPSPSPANGA